MNIWSWPEDTGAIETFFANANQTPPSVGQAVEEILDDVAKRGDEAVSEYTRRFDHVQVPAGKFVVSNVRCENCWMTTPEPLRAALRHARDRIVAFHETQKLEGWTLNEKGFGRIDQRVQPLKRVAVYVPGGKAVYLSTVLMSVIPAQIAGVKEIVLVTPPSEDGWPDPKLLATAHLVGVNKVYRIGGAQAIAALAYGTQTIRKVDKIVGPGNIYVATAKQKLYGRIDIDSVAGPSEILIIADAETPLDLIAADMLAQAEHDQAASAGVILIGVDQAHVQALQSEIQKQLEALPRKDIAGHSIQQNSYIITVAQPDQAVALANLKAPEHLEIMAKNARRLSSQISNAGATFIGRWTPEALGDYAAGPNHTLPTAGTARFFSPLGVWSFYKTSHVIEATEGGLRSLADDIVKIAETEGLEAHARTIKIRLEKNH